MDKPIAWYDPTNGMVSTDKDSPLFTPLGQVLPLYTQQEQEPVAWGVFEGNLHDMFFSQEEAQEMADLKGTHAEVRPLYATPQRTWVGLMRGVRVEGNAVVITVKGGNDEARALCGELINEMEKNT